MSRQGRINNWLSTRLDRPARFFGRLHARLGWPRRLFGAPVFRLTVRGRKSGEPRSVMLILVRRGDDLVVCGSNGGNPKPPSWWLNLVAAGEATVEVGRESWPVRARLVEDDAERAELWRLMHDVYPDFSTYQELTDRRLPVAVLERSG